MSAFRGTADMTYCAANVRTQSGHYVAPINPRLCCNLVLRSRYPDVFAHCPGYLPLFIKFGTPSTDLLGRKSFDVAVIKFPVWVVAPHQRRLDGGSCCWRCLDYT